MSNFKKYTADFLYYSDESADTNIPCKVLIDGGRIIVTYTDDDGLVTYIGDEIGSCHFELRCAERNGHATLHKFPNGVIMEGFWDEDGERGMWRFRQVRESFKKPWGSPKLRAC